MGLRRLVYLSTCLYFYVSNYIFLGLIIYFRISIIMSNYILQVSIFLDFYILYISIFLYFHKFLYLGISIFGHFYIWAFLYLGISIFLYLGISIFGHFYISIFQYCLAISFRAAFDSAPILDYLGHIREGTRAKPPTSPAHIIILIN